MRAFICFVALLLWDAVAFGDEVVFLTHPRTTGRFDTPSVSEAGGPYICHEATNLLAFDRVTGVERLLVAGNVVDACMSLNGLSIYYAQVGKDASGTWCDLFVIPLAGGTPAKLTDAKNEWAGPTGYYKAGTKRYVWNKSPCDTPDGLVFTSNRSGMQPVGEVYGAGFQLFNLKDGIVTKIGHMNLGGAEHPTLGPSGRVDFSTGEQQGLRTNSGNGWGIWSIYPDGGNWQPEFSAIPTTNPMHFQTRTTDGTLVNVQYYDTRVYGRIYAAPPYTPSPFDPPTMFGDPLRQNNPAVKHGWYPETPPINSSFIRWSYQRRGLLSPLPWSHSEDVENKGPDGTQYGMVSHPRGTPGNGIYLTWTGANGDSQMDLGIYELPNIRQEYATPQQMVKVIDRPDRHEWMAMPAVPFKQIYNVDPPKLSYKRAADLPDASPYAVVGSSNVRTLEWTKDIGFGYDELRQPDMSKAKWFRIHGFNPTKDYRFADKLSNIPSAHADLNVYEGFSSAVNERSGVYDKLIPIEEDGSVKAIIPADQPFSFDLLDANYQTLVHAKTWHQLRPGEERTDCAGCHAHNKPETRSFEDSIAGQPGYAALKLDKSRFVEYHRDIKEIDERLELGLGDRPWLNSWEFPGQPAVNPQFLPYNSLVSTWDDDQRLSQAEARLLREWQDTGFLSAGTINGVRIMPEHGTGPYADTVPPTLTVKTYADKTLVGACDPQSGLLAGSLSIKSTAAMVGRAAGAELSDLSVLSGDVWTLMGEPKGTLTVSIRDNQKVTFPGLESEHGNITVVKHHATATTPPDPPPLPTFKAVYVGLGGDYVGPARQNTPDGKLDHHIQLSDVPPNIQRWNVHAGAIKWSNEAEIPLVQVRPLPQSPLGLADMRFAPQGTEAVTEFRVFLLLADGREIQATTTLPRPCDTTALEQQIAEQRSKLDQIKALAQ